MRSRLSKKLLSYAALIALPALTASTPASLNRDDAQAGLNSKPDVLGLDLQAEYAQATFRAPCRDCLGKDGPQSLILGFRTLADEKPCGHTNLFLNGFPLPHGHKGESGVAAHGEGLVGKVPGLDENAPYGTLDLKVNWSLLCIRAQGASGGTYLDNNVTELLTVNIEQVGERRIPSWESVGFTVSFKQNAPPEVLRLSTVPDPSAGDRDLIEAWRNPPTHLRLKSSDGEDLPDANADDSQQVIDRELSELEALQAKVEELSKAIREKEQKINAHIRQQVQSLKSLKEIEDCDSAICVLKAAPGRARGALKSFYSHLFCKSSRMGKADRYDDVWRGNRHKQAPQAEESPLTPLLHTTASSTLSYGTPSPTLETGAPYEWAYTTSTPTAYVAVTSSSWSHNRSHSGHKRLHPAVIVLETLFAVLCCSTLVAVACHRCRCSCCATHKPTCPREELNKKSTSASYRRSRRPFWRRLFIRNNQDYDRIIDYEEKRSLIQQRESVLEAAMSEEIRQLRAVHGVVNSIVQAEEGRAANTHNHHNCPCQLHHHASQHHNHHHHHAYHHQDDDTSSAPYSPTSSTYASSLSDFSSTPMSRTNSLPDYRSETSTEPPAYEEDEDRADVVANGFRNDMPSAHPSRSSCGDSDWSPESSIVDVSPRPSAETLRFPRESFDTFGDFGGEVGRRV